VAFWLNLYEFNSIARFLNGTIVESSHSRQIALSSFITLTFSWRPMIVGCENFVKSGVSRSKSTAFQV
jgi:hypothetical protein